MRGFELSVAIVAAVLVATVSAQRPVAPRPRAPRGTVTISVVATTDLHGGVLPRGDRGGLAAFGGYMRNLWAARAADGGGALLVGSGDMFQGTLESNLNEGAVVVRAYNYLGYAAAAIGNHEFDYGPVGADATPQKPGDDPRGALKARAAQARFPFLSANIVDDRRGKPVAWPHVKPSTMVIVSGVKIGIVGATTVGTPLQTIAANLPGLTFAPLVPAIEREAMALRAQSAVAIVVVAHAGGRCPQVDRPEDTSSCDQNGEIMAVVRALPPGLVDVIAAGHTHAAMAHDIGGTPVVEAYNGGRSFSRIDLSIDRASGAVVGRRIWPPQDIVLAPYEGRPVVPDTTVTAILAPAVRRAAVTKNDPLGVVFDTVIPRRPEAESPMSNLFADAIAESTAGADISIGNGGALRSDLPAGPVTYGTIYEAYPFDNHVVTVNITGEQLARIVSYNLVRTDPPTEILSIGGFRVDAACAGGTLQVGLTRNSGAPIKPDDRVTVALPDFVALGGDGVLTPAGPVGPINSPKGAPIIHDVVASWLRRHRGHMSETQFFSPQNHRWTYPGNRPVMCQ